MPCVEDRQMEINQKMHCMKALLLYILGVSLNTSFFGLRCFQVQKPYIVHSSFWECRGATPASRGCCCCCCCLSWCWSVGRGGRVCRVCRGCVQVQERHLGKGAGTGHPQQPGTQPRQTRPCGMASLDPPLWSQ